MPYSNRHFKWAQLGFLVVLLGCGRIDCPGEIVVENAFEREALVVEAAKEVLKTFEGCPGTVDAPNEAFVSTCGVRIVFTDLGPPIPLAGGGRRWICGSARKNFIQVNNNSHPDLQKGCPFEHVLRHELLHTLGYSHASPDEWRVFYGLLDECK